MKAQESAGPAALLGAYWLMDDSPARRRRCPWCGALPELFAADRSPGRGASVRTVMVAVSALVVLAALGAALSTAD
ncbi:hypothetical protein ACWDG9_44610 [Streptomyces sp. NPDC001073]